MAEVIDRILVRTDVPTTYKIAEDYPLFVEAFHKKEIIYRDDARSRVRITSKFLGIPLTWEGEGTKVKNQKICWVQTVGLLKGLTADWLLSPVSNGNSTEVIIRGHYRADGLSGWVLQLVAPLLISKTTKRILLALKRTAEEQSWMFSK